MPGEEDYEGERARLKRSLSLTSGSGSGRSHYSRHRRHAAGGGYELTPIFTFTHSDKDSWSIIVINIYNYLTYHYHYYLLLIVTWSLSSYKSLTVLTRHQKAARLSHITRCRQEDTRRWKWEHVDIIPDYLDRYKLCLSKSKSKICLNHLFSVRSNLREWR